MNHTIIVVSGLSTSVTVLFTENLRAQFLICIWKSGSQGRHKAITQKCMTTVWHVHLVYIIQLTHPANRLQEATQRLLRLRCLHSKHIVGPGPQQPSDVHISSHVLFWFAITHIRYNVNTMTRHGHTWFQINLMRKVFQRNDSPTLLRSSKIFYLPQEKSLAFEDILTVWDEDLKRRFQWLELV